MESENAPSLMSPRPPRSPVLILRTLNPIAPEKRQLQPRGRSPHCENTGARGERGAKMESENEQYLISPRPPRSPVLILRTLTPIAREEGMQLPLRSPAFSSLPSEILCFSACGSQPRRSRLVSRRSTPASAQYFAKNLLIDHRTNKIELGNLDFEVLSVSTPESIGSRHRADRRIDYRAA